MRTMVQIYIVELLKRAEKITRKNGFELNGFELNLNC